MVWAGISWAGKTELVVLKGIINANEYVNMLSEYLLPFCEEYYLQGDFIFYQNNAAVHLAASTRDFFATEGITDIPWPPRSPNMNCIEHAWREISRRLYGRGLQFDSVEDSCEELFYEWDKLEMSYIRNLVRSMPNRVDMLRRNHGRVRHY